MEKLGIIITILWGAIIGVLIFLKSNEASTLTLNEWGDFLAGTTAPIAFLWLIIGYFLQRKELNMNTKALLEQRDELAKQVKEVEKQTEYLAMSAQAAQEKNNRELGQGLFDHLGNISIE